MPRAALRVVLAGLAAAAMMAILAGPAAASTGEGRADGPVGAPGFVAVHDSRTLATVPHGWSFLQRTPDGLSTLNHLTSLTAGRSVTVHELVFNHAQACAGNGIPGLSACGAADMVPGGPAGYVELNGPTGVASPAGTLTLFDWIGDRSVTNPEGAVVILSFSVEGCGTGLPCANQLAVHNPPD